MLMGFITLKGRYHPVVLASHINSLSFSFFVYKMRIINVLLSEYAE